MSFLGPVVPLFWISADVSSGFKTRVDSALFTFCKGKCNVHFPRCTSGATPAELMTACISSHRIAAGLIKFFAMFLFQVDGKFGNLSFILVYSIKETGDFTKISKAIKSADIIIFNQGLHQSKYLSVKLNDFFHTMGEFLDQETRNTSKQVIIRSTAPQQFVTKEGDTLNEHKMRSVHFCASPKNITHPIPHFTNHFLMQLARRYRFKFLNNYPLLYERGDLMNGYVIQGGREIIDCTHYCYSPEIIWPELVLLTELISG